MARQWRRPSFEASALGGFFLLGAGLLAVTAAVVSRTMTQLNALSVQVRHEREALSALDGLNIALRDAELGVRGYAVTGEAAYFHQYDSAMRLVPLKWGDLASRSETTKSRTLMRSLEPLLAAKIAALKEFAALGPRRPPRDVAIRLLDRNQRALEAFDKVGFEVEKRTLADEAAGLSRRDELAAQALFVGRVEAGLAAALLIAGFVLSLLQLFHRRKAEASEEDARGLMETVFESIAEGLIVADAGGRALVFNPSAQRLLGGRPEAADTGRWAELRGLYHPDGVTPLSAHEMPLVRALHGEPTERMEVCLKQPGSEDCTFLAATGRPLRGPDDALIGAAVVFYDVTARRKADSEIRRLNATLQSSVRELTAANRELEGFTFSVSHGLRTPLRALDGFARLLDRRLPEEDAESRRLLSVIQINAKRMGGLMDDLLAYTDLGRRPLRASTVDIARLVRAVFQEAVRAETPRREPELRVQALPAAHADPEMMREAWLNLLANAVKFSSHAERPLIEVGTAGSNGKTIYFVRDNGVGFNMRYAHRLFGVFQRLHGTDEFEGSGVGLAIVRRIVERHGGQIWAQAEEGVGATFYLSLPTAEEQHGGLA